jgi:hypothetical protein
MGETEQTTKLHFYYFWRPNLLNENNSLRMKKRLRNSGCFRNNWTEFISLLSSLNGINVFLNSISLNRLAKTTEAGS